MSGIASRIVDAAGLHKKAILLVRSLSGAEEGDECVIEWSYADLISISLRFVDTISSAPVSDNKPTVAIILERKNDGCGELFCICAMVACILFNIPFSILDYDRLPLARVCASIRALKECPDTSPSVSCCSSVLLQLVDA